MENEKAQPSGGVIEILTLSLKPNTRDKFHQLYITQSLPLLEKWKFKVVAHGPSRHDADTYYVIRSFQSLEDRQNAEDAFYSSDDWRKGPRAVILALIDHEAYIVVPTEIIKEWSDAITN